MANQEEIESITLKVIGQDGTVAFYTLNMNTQMGEVMLSYCQIVGYPVTSVRFMFEGHRITNTDTPNQLELVNDDIIDVFMPQAGGQLYISPNYMVLPSHEEEYSDSHLKSNGEGRGMADGL